MIILLIHDVSPLEAMDTKWWLRADYYSILSYDKKNLRYFGTLRVIGLVCYKTSEAHRLMFIICWQRRKGKIFFLIQGHLFEIFCFYKKYDVHSLITMYFICRNRTRYKMFSLRFFFIEQYFIDFFD